MQVRDLLSNPGKMSAEIQNKGISGPTEGTNVLEMFSKGLSSFSKGQKFN